MDTYKIRLANGSYSCGGSCKASCHGKIWSLENLKQHLHFYSYRYKQGDTIVRYKTEEVELRSVDEFITSELKPERK